MTITVAELLTVDVSIGFKLDDIVSSGDLFNKRFQIQDRNDCVFADFTGFTPAFDLLDDTGTIVITGTVLPSPGDDTGTFLVALTAAQTAGLLTSVQNQRDLAYRLRIDDGSGVIKTLFCGQFRVTRCASEG